MILWIQYDNQSDETVAKQHLTNKLPQQASDATLSTRGCVSKWTFCLSFCIKPSFFHSYLPSECPLSLCIACSLCVWLNEYYFYSVIIYCSRKLMLAAQVINQPVMRLKVKLKIKPAHTCHILLKVQSSLSYKTTWWAPIIWWPSSSFLFQIGYNTLQARRNQGHSVYLNKVVYFIKADDMLTG